MCWDNIILIFIFIVYYYLFELILVDYFWKQFYIIVFTCIVFGFFLCFCIVLIINFNTPFYSYLKIPVELCDVFFFFIFVYIILTRIFDLHFKYYQEPHAPLSVFSTRFGYIFYLCVCFICGLYLSLISIYVLYVVYIKLFSLYTFLSTLVLVTIEDYFLFFGAIFGLIFSFIIVYLTIDELVIILNSLDYFVFDRCVWLIFLFVCVPLLLFGIFFLFFF